VTRAGLVAALLGVAAGVVAVACDAPHATACSGEPVGTFRFRGEPVTGGGGGTCPFASDAAVTFDATLAFDGDTSAILCVHRAEAEPLRGTRDGDHVEVASPAAAANVGSCTCGVQVIESIKGDVLRADGGGAPGFAGELGNRVAPANGGASCEPEAGDAGPRCGVPCELRWQLTGS
jgi:hypothetical protein